MKPEAYIIKRKRKKYKFARFGEFDNCFEAEEFTAEKLRDFKSELPLVVELGAGSAQFSVELARLTPGKRFVAIDVKADRLQGGAKAALEQGVGNVVFVRAHANQLPELFAAHVVDELWLTFPDPFPKKRHIKHRMTHRHFLRQYRNMLKKDGTLHFKTDNHDLFHWSLEQFVAEKLRLTRLTFDLHKGTKSGIGSSLQNEHISSEKLEAQGGIDDSTSTRDEGFAAERGRFQAESYAGIGSYDFPDEYKIMTTYEKRFVAEDLPIYAADVIFS